MYNQDMLNNSGNTMNNYRNKTEAELKFIIKDANEAAICAKDLENYQAEAKYLDQVNDACTELYKRKQKIKNISTEI